MAPRRFSERAEWSESDVTQSTGASPVEARRQVLYWNLLRLCAPSKSRVAFVCMAFLSASMVGASPNGRVSVSKGAATGPKNASEIQVQSVDASGETKTEIFKGCIKYLGGPGFPDFKGQETWSNELTVSGSEATCTFANKSLEPVTFALSDVTTILYGQASSRRAGTWVSIGVILAPVALLGLLHKSRKHNVLISWKGDSGQERGVYFEVQSSHLRRLLNTVSYRTGKPVFSDEKDRTWLLTQGIQAQIDPSGSSAGK